MDSKVNNDTSESSAYYALFYRFERSFVFSPKVRQAINYAIDRKKLKKRLYTEYNALTSDFNTKQLSSYHPILFDISPDTEYAIRLLEADGWKDLDGDLIREKGKKKLTLSVWVNQHSSYERRLIALIRQQLAELGLQLKVILYSDEQMIYQGMHEDGNAWLRKLPTNQLRTGYGLNGLILDLNQEDSFSKYSNTKVTQWLDKANTVFDQTKKDMYIQKIYSVLREDQPVCFLFITSQ